MSKKLNQIIIPKATKYKKCLIGLKCRPAANYSKETTLKKKHNVIEIKSLSPENPLSLLACGKYQALMAKNIKKGAEIGNTLSSALKEIIDIRNYFWT